LLWKKLKNSLSSVLSGGVQKVASLLQIRSDGSHTQFKRA
jgi:hypothetical protein